MKPAPAANFDIASLLDQIRWSMRDAAAELEVDEATVRRWSRGDAPPELVRWLRKLAAFHRANPAPSGLRMPRSIRPRAGAAAD